MNAGLRGPWRWLALAAIACCAGCASLPPPPDKPVTSALTQPGATALGTMSAAAAPNARYSGFRLLESGEDAFAALAALADRAQRTLDLQYYLMHDDASTRTLLRRVHAAAERGVRVRVLLDDLNTSGADDALLCLTAHPNIELRLYNPFPAGRFSTLTRVLASITDIRRVNQRMHSKMFVADNAMAVTGGRNLGDAYFVKSPSSNFVDLDVIAAGPVVRSLSASFDQFWNSDLAYPVHSLVKKEPVCAGPVAATALQTPAGPATDPPDVPATGLTEVFRDGRLQLSWVPAKVLADEPSKISPEGEPPDPEEVIADDVIGLTRAARREVILISPYFVPGERGAAMFRDLRARGVRVRVLTNSLAATDAPIVHVGYARYRAELLAEGVELHELRNRLGRPRSRLGSFGSSQASLHAKAMVVDRRILLVGSMNMDPRSELHNTELALVLRSQALSAQVVRLFEDVAASSSYRVEAMADGRLRWVGEAPDVPTVEGSEPDAGIALKLLLKLLSPLAPDELL